MPATASAKTATKIMTVNQVVVDNSVAGRDATVPVVTANLMRRKNGKWVSLGGCVVKCYLISGGRRTLVGRQTGSRVRFALAERGMYEIVYSGSRTFKASKAHTSRYDRIAEPTPDPVISVEEAADPRFVDVDVTYELWWNTEAYDGPFSLIFLGMFSTTPDDPESSVLGQSAMFARSIDAPESVHFSYRVPVAQAQGSLIAYMMGGVQADPYVLYGSSSGSLYVLRR
jgi:hypothetical protein